MNIMEPTKANHCVEIEDPARMLRELAARIIAIRDSL